MMEFTRGGVGVEWCGRECRPPLKLFVLGLRDPLLPRLQSRHAVLPQVRVYEIGLAHESQVCPGCGRAARRAVNYPPSSACQPGGRAGGETARRGAGKGEGRGDRGREKRDETTT
eukprot:scaffold260185_cov33-Tisochrysis_lutea.AAC.3